MNYSKYFENLTGFSPYPWQEKFSYWDGQKVTVVSVPTGAGKEFGAVLPWLYGHRLQQQIPSRLIYCLPTRSLVDQVYNNIQKLIEASGLDISFYCLKGGLIEHGYEDSLVSKAVIVGTQDQLLTRALNRGYSVPWEQRPKHAAALNNDCRWILDETQLMGVGFTTALQMHQLRRQLGCYGKTELAVMSATMDINPLIDYECDYEEFGLSEEDLQHPYLRPKLTKLKPLSRVVVQNESEIAAIAIANHQPETLTLIVLNTVRKARAVAASLQASNIQPLVLHSRFLGWKRSQLQQDLYSFKGIVVATQVVEAGVDIDSRLLITEPCPWSSFKQRVGRCGRTKMDQESHVFWLWHEGLESESKEFFYPYEKEDCIWTVQQLLNLNDVGLIPLEKVVSPFKEHEAEWITESVIQKFFTRCDPNFTASDCVRDSSQQNCRVFWSMEEPQAKQIPHQDTLCPVSIWELKKFVQSQSHPVWVWDDGWNLYQKSSQTLQLNPGDLVCLSYESGGYHDDLGWTGNPDDRPTPYSLKPVKFLDDDPPFPHWVSLDIHSGDAASSLEFYRPILRQWMEEAEINQLVDCARWHDWGKAHEIWQHYAQAERFGDIVAKSIRYGNPRSMNGYRHELASAIAAAQRGASFLAQYVIAAHHGKIRENLDNPDGFLKHEAPRGVVLGSKLPACTLGGEAMPETILSYEPDQWKQNVRKLLQVPELGPFKLWYLESLIRNSDVAASILREKEARKN